jgi:hypothetical protein
MARAAKKKDEDAAQKLHPLLRAWFALTVAERWFIGGILAIALVGITARYVHLKREHAAPYETEGLSSAEYGGIR